MAKNKHLKDTERLQIEQWLKERVSIKQIALKLSKSTSTISREIRSRATTSDKYAPCRIHNRCMKRNDCQRRYLCDDKPNCTKRCSICNLCNELCKDYQEQLCYKLYEPPYYRYVTGGLLKARNIDMPRVCRTKPRKSKPVEHKVDSGCRIGRKYAEFLVFAETSSVPIVEMDSVIGRIGGKVLLTMMFKSCDLMLAFIRERNTSQSVIDVFNSMYETLGSDCFKSLFPVILTDNGSEFSNPKALEYDEQGNRRTRIYYCDPCASFQKPNVELNHEFIRKILSKGRSFDDLTQSDISLMISHINSYSREKLNDRSPFDMFSFIYGCDVLEKLGIRRIPANEILLKPSLLKK